jgi:hypothetical protein
MDDKLKSYVVALIELLKKPIGTSTYDDASYK